MRGWMTKRWQAQKTLNQAKSYFLVTLKCHSVAVVSLGLLILHAVDGPQLDGQCAYQRVQIGSVWDRVLKGA